MDDDQSDDYSTVELPPLETEEGREEWAEILAGQDDHTMAENELTWIKCIAIMNDDGDMVIRLIYDDGAEEILDCLVRRPLITVAPTAERN